MARPDLRALRLIAPAIRSRTASLAGAAVLLVAYSAVAVSPASLVSDSSSWWITRGSSTALLIG